jgi:oxygen-independent coproporphyrinogen-3 oxidase
MINDTVNRMPLLGLYIHIPFCVQKCSYCDFYSCALRDNNYLELYTTRLIKDLEYWGAELKNRTINTIFFGGGTPSLLSVPQMTRIMNSIAKNFSLQEALEISVECNPATIDTIKARGYKAAGINRISLGVQSFNPHELELMGRIHSVQDIYTTIDSINTVGFTNFNLDLIYGLPKQTIAGWEKTLQCAVQCNPTHISAYLLQLADTTPMARKIARGSLDYLDEQDEIVMYYKCIDFLKQHNYNHYEISNFARPEKECQHNLLYWHSCEYIGLGAGAVSFIGNRRFMLYENLKTYFANRPSNREELIVLEEMSAQELIVDAIILGLRCVDGINKINFIERFGKDIFREYQSVIEECVALGLLIKSAENIKLTQRGYFLSNQVFRRFL